MRGFPIAGSRLRRTRRERQGRRRFTTEEGRRMNSMASGKRYIIFPPSLLH